MRSSSSVVDDSLEDEVLASDDFRAFSLLFCRLGPSFRRRSVRPSLSFLCDTSPLAFSSLVLLRFDVSEETVSSDSRRSDSLRPICVRVDILSVLTKYHRPRLRSLGNVPLKCPAPSSNPFRLRPVHGSMSILLCDVIYPHTNAQVLLLLKLFLLYSHQPAQCSGRDCRR